jgi:tetratricopeptide (TPR) repeat protein
MRRTNLVILLILLGVKSVAGQAGNHTLLGDIKIDESQVKHSKPITLQVALYQEGGNLLSRQAVPGNGRYRFLNLRDGRYEVVVEVENVEKARVLVHIRSPFKTDFRQDIEFQLRDTFASGNPGVLSAADYHDRTNLNKTLFRRANGAIDRRRYEEAVSLLRQIVESDPSDSPAWLELGTVYFIQKDFERAEQSYLKSLSTQPNYSRALISLGRLRITVKNLEGAIDVLTRAVQTEPMSAQANYFLGEAYLQVKLGSKAVPYLNTAIKLDPSGMAEAHLRLAALYNARGLKDKAAAEYEAFLKKRPDYPDKKRIKEYISANKKH